MGLALLVACLGLAAVWVYLSTPPGDQRLRDWALKQANTRLAGTLSAEKAGVRGAHLELRGVRLEDPEGRPVAQVDRLKVRVSWLALLRRTIRVQRLEVHRPRVVLSKHGETLDLLRAVQPVQTRAAPPTASRPPKLTIELSAVSIHDGELVAPDARIRISDLEATGSLHWQLPFQRLEATLRADAILEHRVRQPFRLEARAGGTDPLELSIELEAGGAHARATLTRTGSNTFHLALERAELSPQLMVSLLPRWPIKVPVNAQAELTGSLQQLTGQLRLTAAQATIRADLWLRDGQWGLQSLEATLPGSRASLSGNGSFRSIEVQGVARGSDLNATARALEPILGIAHLPVRGSGVVHAQLSGRWRRLALHAWGDFPSLGYARIESEVVQVRLAMPRLGRPLEATGNLSARQVAVGEGKVLRPVRLAVRDEQGQVVLEGATGGWLIASLEIRGLPHQDRRGFEMTSFSLRYPRARWRATQTAQLRLSAQELSLRGVRLRSQRQTLEGTLVRRHRALWGQLRAREVVLQELPAILWASTGIEAPVEGVLSAELDVSGTTRRPVAQGAVSLRRGRYGAFDRLNVTFDGRLSPDRASGTLSARALGARLRGRLDVPLQGWGSPEGRALSLNLQLSGLRVEQLLARLSSTLPLTGRASGTVELKGTTRSPMVEVQLDAESLHYPPWPTTDAKVNVRADSGGVRLEGSGTTEEGRAQLTLSTPLDLQQILAHRSQPGRLLQHSWTLSLDASALRLPLLNRTPLIREAQVYLEGPLRAATGRGIFRMGELHPGAAPPVELEASFLARPQSVRVEAQAGRTSSELVRAALSIQSGLGALFDAAARPSLPFQLEATASAVPANELRAWSAPKPERGGLQVPPLSGILAGRLEVQGTLQSPDIALRANAQALGPRGTPHTGNVSLSFTHREGLSRLNAELQSGSSGTMTLELGGPMPLSYDAWGEGLSLSTVPVRGTFHARAFDISFLSVVTPRIVELGGTLEADAQFRGTLGVPDIRGRAQLSNGRLALVSYGDYRDIRFLLTGNSERLDLKNVVVKSGRGQANLRALALRRENGYGLQLAASMENFPIVADDQLVATVSVNASASGTMTPRLIELTPVKLRSATIELPEVRRRDLQTLAEPQDIVFVREGVLLDVGPKRADPDEPYQGLRLRAELDASHNVWIRGNDVNVEVGLSPDFRVEIGREIQVYGKVGVHRGRVDVLGRHFELADTSTLSFTGPPTNPRLDVEAEHVNASAGVTIRVAVRGPIDALEFLPSSEPPLSETEIYTVLATGRRNLRRGTGGSTSAGGAAASVIGSLAATELRNLLSEALPLDVLSIEAGDEGIAGTTLEAGTYVGDDVYLGFTRRVGGINRRDENTYSVELDYQISRRWSFEASWGDAPKGGVDLIWSNDY